MKNKSECWYLEPLAVRAGLFKSGEMVEREIVKALIGYVE